MHELVCVSVCTSEVFVCACIYIYILVLLSYGTHLRPLENRAVH